MTNWQSSIISIIEKGYTNDPQARPLPDGGVKVFMPGVDGHRFGSRVDNVVNILNNAENHYPYGDVTPNATVGADKYNHVIISPPVAETNEQQGEGGAVKEDRDNIKEKTADLPRNIILQGPPGTSKTWLAKRMARVFLDDAYDSSDSLDALIEKAKNLDEDPSDESLKPKDSSGRFKIVQFHPSLTYEDFVRGLVSAPDGSYKPKNKVFGEICAVAKKDKGKRNHVIIIDEINRANLPAVLGELIYALEYRDNDVETPYNEPSNNEICTDDTGAAKKAAESSKITIPSNLFVIGTMNTADRSIGQMDYALRRRFVFIDQLPDLPNRIDGDAKICFEKILGLFVEDPETVNWAIGKNESLSTDFRPRDVAIGHTYFLKEWEFQLRYKVIPVLEEYIKDGVLLDKNKKLSEAIEEARVAALKPEKNESADVAFARAFVAGL